VTVLAVDDDPDSLMLVNNALQIAGASVLSANSALAALAILDRHRPDVIVSDIGMPVMDGFEFIGRVREREQREGGRIPAAALTAYAGPDARVRSLTAGFQAHLAKPIEPADLVTAVAALVKSRPSGPQ
jgi:CheY-like chemotaxis protein